MFGGRDCGTKKVRIVKENVSSPFRVGDEVVITVYGTFGAWSKDGKWVDFYSCKVIEE